jgi:hypothetical protein
MKIIFAQILFIFAVVGCFGQNQSKAPESGVYKGTSTSSNITSTQAGTGLPIYGSGVQDNTFGVSSILTPSLFGDLIINKDGTYKLSKAGETGRWKYDEATGKVSFTGKLSTSEIKYNYYPNSLNFQIRFPYNGEFISLSFSKKREIAYIKPKNPNGDFGGIIIGEGDGGLFQIIDVTSGTKLKSARGYNPSKNANGEIAALSSFDGKSDVYIYDKNGELKETISGQKIASQKQIKKYQTVSLSPDGNYIILGGSVFSYNWDGDPTYFIFKRNGEFLGKVDAVSKVFTLTLFPASWTADNQALIKGENKLVLANPSKGTLKTIYSQGVELAAISQNGKNVVFLKDKQLNLLNVESGKTEPFAKGKYDEKLGNFSIYGISWSPDGTSIAITVKGMLISGYKIILLSTDGENGKFLADQNGEDWLLSRQSVSW